MEEPTRNLGIIDLNTGTLLGQFEEGASIISKKQKDYYQMKLQQTEAQKDYGPFTWMLYNCGQEIFKDLTASTITRLMYMSTFLGYDGFLVYDNKKTLKKDALKKKLGVSNQEFSSFWKETAVDNNIVYEDNTRIYMNKKIFLKGVLPKEISKNHDVIKLAANGVRTLYENVDSVRSHKNLSYLFRMIPFLNKEWNILSKNPNEKEREFIEYMTMSEFCDEIGYNKSHARRLVNSLSGIRFGGQPALLYVTLDFAINKTKIVMNPNLLWAGTQWENVKYLSYWFNS